MSLVASRSAGKRERCWRGENAESRHAISTTEPARRLDDSRIPEKLSEKATYGSWRRRVRSSQIDEQDADAIRAAMVELRQAEISRHETDAAVETP